MDFKAIVWTCTKRVHFGNVQWKMIKGEQCKTGKTIRTLPLQDPTAAKIPLRKLKKSCLISQCKPKEKDGLTHTA